MSTYIAGYDGTDASRAAVRFASRLARRSSARVIAVHVSPRVHPIVARGSSPAADAAMQEEIASEGAELLEQLADEPGVERLVVSADSPARGLHELAEHTGAEVIAIGVTHHGWLGRVIPGTVGHHLLHGAPCAITVVPAAPVPEEIRTIAVGYDGSDESAEALRAAERLAGENDAALRIVQVAAPPPYMTAAYPGVGWGLDAGSWSEERARLRERLESVAAAATAPRGSEPVLVDGPAGPGLVEACRDGVDLLAMGSRGYGPARTVLVGSTSRYVADHAPCPVVIVPRGVSLAAGTGEDAAVTADSA